MRSSRIWIAVMGLLLFSVSPGLAAQTDGPLLVASDPEAGAEMSQAPERIRITFSEPLDPSSQIRVVDECERLIDNGATVVTANYMEARLKRTPSGPYSVYYRAKGPGGLSGETVGSFQFVVEAGRPCAQHADHGSGHGDKHQGGGKEHPGRHDGEHGGDGHSGETDHSGMSHSDGQHSGETDHSKMSHSGSGPGSRSHGSDHKGKNHGPNHERGANGKHGPDHEDRQDEGSAPSNTLAAAEGSRPLGSVEGSAVITALAAALLLGTAGGWLIRTKRIFL